MSLSVVREPLMNYEIESMGMPALNQFYGYATLFEHDFLNYDIIRCSTAFTKGKRNVYERLNG